MYDHCPSCGQKTELEVGFYYGTGYVSYGLTVGLSVMTFVAYWLIVELPFHSTVALITWIGINLLLLIALQPVIVRISRTLWLSWFV